MDASYVPNNPQFGLQLECNWSSGPNATLQSSACTDDLSSCWSEDMGSFSLPLDLEPLPSLFPFSPCNNTANYKSEAQNQPSPYKQPSSDMADVLLSLKHAVVHPGQSPAEKYDQQHLYHPQVLLSPGGYSGSLCDQGFAQQPMFPSMSVNVSMNMTMHGYHPSSSYPANEISCPQWSATPQAGSTPTYQTQGLLSPSYGGTTYSFTADFRPPQETPVLASYKSVPMSFSSPRRRHSINLLEEDNQKPNVCRICGKSYARPSTLKTHLRTHSGCQPDSARPDPLRGKALPVSRLRPPLLPELLGDDPHAHPLRGAALPLPPVQEGLLRQQHPHQASQDTQRREALRVQTVSFALQPKRQPQQTHAGARGCQHDAPMTGAAHLKRLGVLTTLVGLARARGIAQQLTMVGEQITGFAKNIRFI
nr:PREDICTED: glass isoform X2 [Tribolium castaneum]|eukprot:XP_015838871.1 PREDICTED: glass isoform X2 [Tribolium castaneum]